MLSRKREGGSSMGLPSDRSKTASAPRSFLMRSASSNILRIHDERCICSRIFLEILMVTVSWDPVLSTRAKTVGHGRSPAGPGCRTHAQAAGRWAAAANRHRTIGEIRRQPFSRHTGHITRGYAGNPDGFVVSFGHGLMSSYRSVVGPKALPLHSPARGRPRKNDVMGARQKGVVRCFVDDPHTENAVDVLAGRECDCDCHHRSRWLFGGRFRTATCADCPGCAANCRRHDARRSGASSLFSRDRRSQRLAVADTDKGRLVLR